jgi:hypothetical protein
VTSIVLQCDPHIGTKRDVITVQRDLKTNLETNIWGLEHPEKIVVVFLPAARLQALSDKFGILDSIRFWKARGREK